MAPKRPATGPTALSSGPQTLKTNSSLLEIAQYIWSQYTATTPQRTHLLDVFMAYLILVAGVQFVYCVVAGNFPFNAFLSGFCAALGQFVLTASLRMQMSGSSAGNKGSSSTSKGKKTARFEGDEGTKERYSDERAFADYIFGSVILHFFCVNFIN